METPTAPVEAPPPAAPPVPASIDKIAKNDFSGYREDRAAERKGTPPPPVEPKPAEAAPVVAKSEPVAKRITLTQDELNERTRRAVESAIRDHDATKQPQTVAPPPAESTPQTPLWKRYAALPDAPKLTDKDAQGNDLYASLEEHSAAMAVFIEDKRYAERTAETTARTATEKRIADHQQASRAFGVKVQEALAADPDIASKVPPEVLRAKPLSAFSPQDIQAGKATFANVVAEIAFRSSDPVSLLTHLHAHPDEATAINRLDPSEWLIELKALDRSLRKTAASPPPDTDTLAAHAAVPSTITTAEPPPTTLKRSTTVVDPKADALNRRDFGAYNEIKKAERRAKFATA